MGLQTRVGTEGRSAQRIGRFRILRATQSEGARNGYLASTDDGTKVSLETFAVPGAAADGPPPAEATTYSRLTHPGILRVIDAFFSEGCLVVASETLDGTTLDVLRAALERKQQTVGHACWVYIASCGFDALAAAHAARSADGHPAPVLHRNLAPSSLHVTTDGTVKLGHFDVSGAAASTGDSSRVQRAPGRYLAPEQAKLQPPGPQADVYSLSLVLWELLTRRRVGDLGNRPLDALDGDIETGVRAVIQAGLEPDPSKRTLGAARAAALLRAAIDVDAAKRELAGAMSRAHTSGPTSIAPPVAPSAPASAARIPSTSSPVDSAPAAPVVSAPIALSPALASTVLAPMAPTPPPLRVEPTPPPLRVEPTPPPLRVEPTPPPLPGEPTPPPLPAGAPLPFSSAAAVLTPVPTPAHVLARPPTPAPVILSASSADAPARDSGELDRWFDATRPPTPSAFPSAYPSPIEPLQQVSAEVRQRSAQRRRLARNVIIGCMSVGMSIVIAALCVRARAAVSPPHPTVSSAAALQPTAAASLADHSPASPPANTAPAAAPEVAAAPEQGPAPAPPASAAAPSTPAATAIPANMGELRMPAWVAGHRLFVDGRPFGEASTRVRVPCGRHTVRVGSAGRKVTVDAACGRSVAVNP
jgi:serine/threonine protein kinase